MKMEFSLETGKLNPQLYPQWYDNIIILNVKYFATSPVAGERSCVHGLHCTPLREERLKSDDSNLEGSAIFS